jgi:hypothetical protein
VLTALFFFLYFCSTSLFLHDAFRLQSLGNLAVKEKRERFSIRPYSYNEPEFLFKNESKNENIQDIRCFAGTK